MAEKNQKSAFVDDCRDEREALTVFVQKLESGKLGMGVPVTVPAVNPTTVKMIAHFKECIAKLDGFIGAYEEEQAAKVA